MRKKPRSAPCIAFISDDDRAFFIQLGERITRLRKAQGITQVQLAGQLGVSQQTVTAYGSGNRRVPISHLPRLAALLGTSIEELIGEPPKAAKRGPTPKLQQQLEQVQLLPKAKQRIVSEVLDSLLAANR